MLHRLFEPSWARIKAQRRLNRTKQKNEVDEENFSDRLVTYFSCGSEFPTKMSRANDRAPEAGDGPSGLVRDRHVAGVWMGNGLLSPERHCVPISLHQRRFCG